MAWRPLLTGTLAGRARRAITDIQRGLTQSLDGAPSPTLATGDAGLALFFGYLHKVSADGAALERTFFHLDRAMDGAASLRRLGLFTGLSGLAWTLIHLTEQLAPAIDPYDPQEIDTLLQEALQTRPWPWHLDLIYGLAGLAVYALDHPDPDRSHRLTRLIVQHIAEGARAEGSGRAWRVPPALLSHGNADRFPRGRYDLGMSHGTAGILGALAKALPVAGKPARRLLERGVAWLLTAKRLQTEGSVFPPYFDITPRTERSARSAWCYGDPGIAALLWRASHVLGQPELGRQAIGLALRDAERPEGEQGVVDTTFCHGAAGLGHLYNRLYQATGEERLAEVARRWFAWTLERQRPGGELGGFFSWWPRQGHWHAERGLLNGSAGVGLALLAAVSSVEPCWDRAMMLDLPQSSSRGQVIELASSQAAGGLPADHRLELE